MESSKLIMNYCISCRQETKHNILFVKEKMSNPEEYHCCEYYRVVECAGCENVSFRYEFHDFESYHHDEDGNDEYEINIDTYPKALKSHKTLNSTYNLPPKIKVVYLETILSFKAESFLLTGVGFRAVIEAICIEEKIKGSNLEQKINNLVKNKLITEKEAERLHTIRFLGNDSIHDMEVPTEKKLYLVLDIVEHLLRNLYLMDKEAKSFLDFVIKEYEDFEELVLQSSMKIKEGEEKTVKQILGKHIRRLGTNLLTFEPNFIQRIKNGEVLSWELGTLKSTATNSVNQQHYIRKKIEETPF